MNALMTQLDLNAIVGRLDMNRMIENVDVNAVLEKVDVDGLVERTDLGPIIAHAGAGVAAEAVDAVRSVGVSVDGGIHRLVDRILRRARRRSGGPPLLVARTAVS